MQNKFESTEECESYFYECFEKTLQGFKLASSALPDSTNGKTKVPLIFVDGIRNYKTEISLDSILFSRCLDSIENLHYVLNVDTDFAAGLPRNRKSELPSGSTFSVALKVKSLELHDKDAATTFLENFCIIKRAHCIKYHFGDSKKLLNRLVRLNFYTIDSFQLHLLLPYLSQNEDIYKVYESYANAFFHWNRDQAKEARENAYKFLYTDDTIDINEYYFSQSWRLFRRHASFIDYYIACDYVQRIRDLASKLERSENFNHDSYEIINKVYPKSVTRFIRYQICSEATGEKDILKLAEHYEKMGIYAKSEMTYWLGRITHATRKNAAWDLLLNLYNQGKKNIMKIDYTANLQNYRNELFLLRGIAVSIIYLNCKPAISRDISNDYIKSLIKDPVAAEINRGFHLEYYGDISYIPASENLSYEDRPDVGKNTLDHLFMNCESQEEHPSYELWLFTICSILQVRMVIPNYHNCCAQTNFNLRLFVRKMVTLLEKYTKSKALHPFLREYFVMMKEDGDRFLREYDNKSALHAIESSLYGYYSSLKDYSRSGWVSHKINDAESITEHIYNTWLLAFLLLPDSNDYSDLIDDRSYSKDEVLRTILIHDLAERTTGDIERPDKIKNQDQYDFAEHMAMSTGLLLKGTYPGISNMYNDYQRWIAWRDQSTYNAQIAKDLDRIQAIFQLCEYLILQKGDFSPDKVKSWVREYFELRTKVGQRLFVKVILNNPKFDKLELLNIIPELKGIT